jgi:pectinesterase inhibitor-like protein
MASSTTMFVLFSLFFAASQTQQATAISILAACKTVGGGSDYVGIQFCMSALGSDARSANAHSYQDFAIVAVDLLTANVTSTKNKIDGLLRGGAQSAATARCLRSCQGLYGDIAHGLPGCAAAVKSSKFAEATSSLEKWAGSAKACENGFVKSSVASPVTAEDDNAFELAKLAVALISVEED